MSRLYRYFEYGKDEPVEVSSDYIVKTCKKHVKELAEKVNKLPVTDQDVIDWFVTTHWAWEVDDDTY